MSANPATSNTQQWLFRKGELVLGPLTNEQLIQELYTGQIDRTTEISLLGQNQFRRVGDVDFFRVHLAKAEAKLRVDAAAQQARDRAVKRKAILIGVLTVGLVTAATGALLTARYLAHRALGEDDLPGFEMITMEPPTITVANRGDEMLAYPLDAAGKPVRGGRPGGSKKASGGAAPGARASNADSDGLATAVDFDQDAINQVVAANQKKLYPCLLEEAKKQPEVRARIPIEFVIGNDGKVTKVWVDHPSFKDGPLSECLLKALQKWPFKPYQGERATVGLSFNVGKTGG